MLTLTPRLEKLYSAQKKNMLSFGLRRMCGYLNKRLGDRLFLQYILYTSAKDSPEYLAAKYCYSGFQYFNKDDVNFFKQYKILRIIFKSFGSMEHYNRIYIWRKSLFRSNEKYRELYERLVVKPS